MVTSFCPYRWKRVGISEKALDVGALMLFRGSAEICGGLARFVFK